MDQENVQKLIEAVLFYRGEPTKKSVLAKTLGVPPESIAAHLADLKRTLTNRGITLVEDGDMVALATIAEAKEIIHTMRREEMEGPLGKAGLETLAIILYQSPISRAEIEYIRGVNSSSILRSLTMRGLIERKENPQDARGYLYSTTPELPAALGVSSYADIPEYERMRAQIDSVLKTRDVETPPEEYES